MDSETVYVGCYTPKAGGNGIGIHPFRIDGTALDPIQATDPSFLSVHPRLPILYAVSEQEQTALSAYAIAANGNLRLLNTISTGGRGGCHLAVDPQRNLVIVAHYTDGSVTICSVADDGALDQVVATHTFRGRGPDPERQEQSHAHMAIQDGSDWLITDLGADRIHRLRLDGSGAITAATQISTPPGSGPRHLVISDDTLVLACELSAELWLARRTAGEWAGMALLPSSAIPTSTRIYPSGIILAGDRIVVANRGSDTIATFALDPSTATLTLLDESPTGGAWPRDLRWHRGQLWVANQHSDSVTVFEPDGDSWRLIRTLRTPSPACIVIAGKT